jgi:hypothetical protein
MQTPSGCARLILRGPRLALGLAGRQPRRRHGGIGGGRLSELVLGLLGGFYPLLGRREVLLGGVRLAQGILILSPGHRYLLGVAGIDGRIAVFGRPALVSDFCLGQLFDGDFGFLLALEVIREVG